MNDYLNSPAGFSFSSTVIHTGKPLVFLPVEDQKCKRSIDEVINEVAVAIKALQDSTNLSTSDLECDSEPAKVNCVLVDHEERISALNALISSLNIQLAALNVGTEIITIDLGELAPGAAPCQQGTNQYSLSAILNLFKNEIIQIKQQL